MFINLLVADLRYAARTLRRSWAFSTTVVLTMAIGIGGVAAVLAITDATYLRKIPVAEPDRLVEIRTFDRRSPGMAGSSFAEVPELKRATPSLDLLATYSNTYVALGGELAGRSVYGSFISGDFFPITGLRPARGRFIRPDEVNVGAVHPIAVISDVLWTEVFGRDEAIVGKRARVGDGDVVIVGVAPRGFTGMHAEGRVDIWMPATLAEAIGSRPLTSIGQRGWGMMVGLRGRGATLAEVQGGLDRAARTLAQQHPATHESVSYRAHSGSRFMRVKERVDTFAAFMMVLIVVGLMHLAACANIVALLIARAQARRRELGVRICLGASRARVISYALAEPIILGLGGAAGGLLAARGLTRAIGSMQFMSALEPRLDARLVAIVLCVAVLTVLQFGLVPALAASRLDPIDVVRGNARRDRAASGTLIGAQIAVSLVLVVQAGLLVSKFRTDAQAEPGFAADRIVASRLSLSRDWIGRGEEWSSAFEQATARLAAVPGVRQVTVTSAAPLRNREWTRVSSPDTDVDGRQVLIQRVSGGYFRTIGARMVRGRELEATDLDAKAGVGEANAVVNETLAGLYWPGASAEGRVLVWNRRTYRVAGVVSDLRDGLVSRAVPTMYVPMQRGTATFTLLALVDGDADGAVTLIGAALRGSLPETQVQVESMNAIRDDALSMSRVIGIVLSACAGVALLLAAIGIYGTLAMWVAQRRGEIGVRIALGAHARHVYQLLLARAGRPIVIGFVVGTLAASALAVAERASFGPSLRLDWIVATLALLILGSVVAGALIVPAYFATRTDPARVMRHEGGDA